MLAGKEGLLRLRRVILVILYLRRAVLKVSRLKASLY
jgi:hypothetical protein